MKIILTTVLVVLVFVNAFSQIPKNGIYTYTIAFAEWGGKSMGATCTVVIKGDSIKVIHNGTKNLTGRKGEVIDQGIIMRHNKTRKWIIGHSSKDKDAKQVGGCSDGPLVIEFTAKRVWFC